MLVYLSHINAFFLTDKFHIKKKQNEISIFFPAHAQKGRTSTYASLCMCLYVLLLLHSFIFLIFLKCLGRDSFCLIINYSHFDKNVI